MSRRTNGNDFDYVNNVNPISAPSILQVLDWTLNTDEITTRNTPVIDMKGANKLAVVASSKDGAAGAVTGTLKLYRNNQQIGSDISVAVTPASGKVTWQLIEVETDLNHINLAETATLSYAVAAGAEGSSIKIELVFLGAV